MEASVSELGASLSQRLNSMIATDSPNYNSWRSLILEMETTSQDHDIDSVTLLYDHFLSKFPLCHWHLEKYAHLKTKFYGVEESIKIFERGVGTAMFSVGFWVDYFTFGLRCFANPEDVRRLFGRALSYVGRDYFCHALWDKYMEYEFNQQGWYFLAESYVQVLRFPTKKLHFYYNNFKQFVDTLEEEMDYEKNHNVEVEQLSIPCASVKVSRDEISVVIKNMLGSSSKYLKCKALERYGSIGEESYRAACQLNEKIKFFEANIKRRFFCVTPLDEAQLNNWHLYLDFIEKQENLDWAVKLYERCLISCANYPEFWMRYVNFLESKKGRELAISTLDRATQIFLKNVPEIHLFSARFKEHVGDVDGARMSLLQCDTKIDSYFLDKVVMQAGLERRLGNIGEASFTYEEALKTATTQQKIQVLPKLFSQYAQLTYMITGSAAAAIDKLMNGIQNVPHCRILFEELIKFAMIHDGAAQLNIIDSVINDAISPGLDEDDGMNAKDREIISCMFIEFANLRGTIHDVRKAWNRHTKLFPERLRSGSTYKHSAAGVNMIMNKKVCCNPAVDDQPSQNHLSAHPMKVQAQGLFEFPENLDFYRSHRVMKKQSSKNDCNIKTKETIAVASDKIIVPSKVDASQDDEPSNCLSCQSKEDKQGPVDVSVELANQSKDIALRSHDSDDDLSWQLTIEKPGPINVSSELINQSGENSLVVHYSTVELRKPSGTTEPVEMLAQPDFNHEFSPEKRTVSSDKLREKDCPRTGEDSINLDHPGAAPEHASLGFREPEKVQEHQVQQSWTQLHHHLNKETGDKMLVNREITELNASSAKNGCQVPTARTNPLSSMCSTAHLSTVSAAQSPVLPFPLVSFPQQNTLQSTLINTQQPDSTQGNQIMDQMMQYHYHQQHLLQQQYQQQLHMQQSFLHLHHQYASQHHYQPEPQQHNQQHLQLVPQQYYVHGQHQQQPHQQLTPLQPFHQHIHHHQQNQQIIEHQQLKKGQPPHQPQELEYHVNPLAYQQTAVAQGQQIIFPQYQHYQQGYQHQQQSLDGHLHNQELLNQHPDQKKQNEQLQKQHLIISEQKQDMGQNLQAHKYVTPDDDGAEESSNSHVQGQ